MAVSIFKLSIHMMELLCRQRGEVANAAAQQGFSEFLLRIGCRPASSSCASTEFDEPRTQSLVQVRTDSGTAALWLAEASSPPRTLIRMPSPTKRCKDFQARCGFLWRTIVGCQTIHSYSVHLPACKSG